MFEPLRFLHVADAGLDRPLGDLGPLPEHLQELAEEATLIAFDQMIAGAISQQVDCILLAGNTFTEADHSLRARLALLEGLSKLEEQGISVFALPGPKDPESAWRAIPELPGHVTLVTSSDPEDEESHVPVAIMREGRVIATVAAGTLSQLAAGMESAAREGTSENSRWSPFRIGMLTAPPSGEDRDLTGRLSECGCDYLAVPSDGGWFEPGQTLNTRDGIAHHPGRLQALAARETGPHGATLIEVDQNGEIKGTFLPFACARRLRFELSIEALAGLEEISEAMQLALLEETGQPGELVWFITWVLEGGGAFFESLQEAEVQTRLLESLPDSQGSLAIHHQLRFQESPAPLGEEESACELEQLFLQALDKISADEPRLVPLLSEALLSDDVGLEAGWRRRLLPLIGELEADEILARARVLGSQWFPPAGES